MLLLLLLLYLCPYFFSYTTTTLASIFTKAPHTNIHRNTQSTTTWPLFTTLYKKLLLFFYNYFYLFLFYFICVIFSFWFQVEFSCDICCCFIFFLLLHYFVFYLFFSEQSLRRSLDRWLACLLIFTLAMPHTHRIWLKIFYNLLFFLSFYFASTSNF